MKTFYRGLFVIFLKRLSSFLQSSGLNYTSFFNIILVI